jgi:hypothetical protein
MSVTNAKPIINAAACRGRSLRVALAVLGAQVRG